MPQYPQYQACKARATKHALTPTPADIEGPFYKADAPFVSDLAPGHDTLDVHGTVRDTAGNPLPGAIVDVWQADTTGTYDLAGYALRGKTRADADGQYRFKTLHPGFYKISDPGQPDEFRCAHVHVKVWVGGTCVLTTQLYFSGDPYNATDAWFDARRVLPADGRFDFVVPPAV